MSDPRIISQWKGWNGSDDVRLVDTGAVYELQARMGYSTNFVAYHPQGALAELIRHEVERVEGEAPR